MTDDRMMKGGQIKINCLVGLALFALLNLFNYYYDDPGPSTLRGETSTGRQFSQGNGKHYNIGGPTFVFVMGVEGSGHHFINSLLAKSPYMNIMRELNMCDGNKELYKLSAEFMHDRKPGLMKPYGSNPNARHKKNNNVNFDTRYNNVVGLLRTISQKIVEHSTKHENINVPINANSCAAPSMLSYPNYRGVDRSLQNFNMDLFYTACADANVNCKHVYLYRDPYDILKSTTINRPFNNNVSDGIRLYTSVLQQIHSQLVSYPTRNDGCFGFLDVNGGYERVDDWIRFGNLFGFKTNSKKRKEGFLNLAKGEMMTGDGNKGSGGPIAMTDEMKLELVSQYDMPLMRSFQEIHDRVKDYCYESVLLSSESESESVEDSNIMEEQLMLSVEITDSSSMLEEGAKHRGLVHVFSPFRGNRGSINSLEQIEQVAMLTSVRQAKENFITTKFEGRDSKEDDNSIVIFDEIVIVCAVTDQDDTEWTNLLTNYCDEILTLPRNVRDQYGQGLKPLPFVQDIINAGMSIGAQKFGEDDYYLMFTNADICLTENFFSTLHDKHLTKYKEAVIINRMTVSHLDAAVIPRVVDDGDLSLESIEGASMEALQQAKQEYANNRYKRHPGSDCFVAHSSIWQSIYLGDVFLGHPPVAAVMKLAFTQIIGIDKYGFIASNKDGTFHFGNDRLWKKKGAMNKFPSDFDYSAEEAIDLIQHCVALHGNELEKHWVLNGINCGKLLYQQESVHGTTIFRQAFLTKEEESKDSKVLYPHCNWKAGQCEYTTRHHDDVHSIRILPMLKRPGPVSEIMAMFQTTETDVVEGEESSELVTTVGIPLIHVLSPYHERNLNPFSPLDFEQWAALASVRVARDYFRQLQSQRQDVVDPTTTYGFDSVILVCPILEYDAEAIYDVLVPYCDHIIPMTRSTATEYPEHNLKALPFHQDIVDAGRSIMGSDDTYLLMMSNADIILTRDFYTDVEHTMRTRSASQALSFNRKTIDLNYLNMPYITDESIASKHAAALEVLQQGQNAVAEAAWVRHFGFDCFIFRSSFLKEYNWGDMFAGYPWWSIHTNWALNIMALGYENGAAKMFPKGGTYHFGNEMNWRPEYAVNNDFLLNPNAENMAFWKGFTKDELEWILWCPMVRYPPNDVNLLQNTINCGKWFKPNRPDGSMVPAFVNEGYAEKYYNRHGKYVQYLEGYPLPIGFFGALKNKTPNEKREWIEKWG